MTDKPTPVEPDDDAEPDTADLAAEIDDEPDPDTVDVDLADTVGAAYTCEVVNGPWVGRTVQVRYPLGFLLVDTVRREMWFYDRDQQSWACEVRNGAAMPLDDDTRWEIADGDEFDILVIDAETGEGPS